MTELRAVLLDWGGTLTGAHDVDLRAEWVAFADGYGTLACARDQLAGRMLVAADEVWARSRVAPAHASGRLAEVLAAVGLDAESDDPATQAGLASWRDYWEPRTMTHPGAEGLLRVLHGRGLKVALLSNSTWPAAELRAILDRDGVGPLFDAVVVSAELPVTKPHPDAFLAAAAAVGCAPEECVHVGDQLFQDVLGAQRAGMRAILIDRGQASAASLPQGADAPVPDAQVRDLTDVADVIADWQAH